MRCNKRIISSYCFFSPDGHKIFRLPYYHITIQSTRNTVPNTDDHPAQPSAYKPVLLAGSINRISNFVKTYYNATVSVNPIGRIHLSKKECPQQTLMTVSVAPFGSVQIALLVLRDVSPRRLGKHQLARVVPVKPVVLLDRPIQ